MATGVLVPVNHAVPVREAPNQQSPLMQVVCKAVSARLESLVSQVSPSKDFASVCQPTAYVHLVLRVHLDSDQGD